MSRLMVFGIALILIIVSGCALNSNAITFEQGVKRINEMDEKFGATIKTPPNSTENIDSLLAELTGFSAVNKDIPLLLSYLLDFKIKMLEAEKLHTEGWQWDKASTTEYGFGCKKGSARILNSSKIRNASAYKGYEAIEALQLLVDEFPNEAKGLDLSQKDVLFLNAAYQQVEDKAIKDAKIVRSLCKEQIEKLNITI
ncbi:MAG: hypothetical protein V1831_02645 [Candidatus Woesearchaeota archaeon]